MPPTMSTSFQPASNPNFGNSGGFSNPSFPNTYPTTKDITKGKQPDLFKLLQSFGFPELGFQTGLRGPISNTFMNYIGGGPGGAMGAAADAAKGYAADIFRPGGDIQKSIMGAMGGMAGKGFQPGSAEGDVNAITRGGVRDVSNFFTSQAVPLAQQWGNIMSGGFGQVNQSVEDLINSLFTGGANILQLRMAQKSMPKGGLLGLGIGPF